MTISANFPNVQPSLLLDFANAKQLPPQVTFTRATTATYYDGSTTALADQNLLLWSQAFDTAPWSGSGYTLTANATTAPDGTTTAESFVPNTNAVANHQLAQNITCGANTTHTVSIYAKAFGYTKFAFRESVATGAYATFDLASSGSVISTGNIAAITIVGATITSVGSGWFRATVTFTASVASAYGMGFYSLNNTYTSGDPYNAGVATGNGTDGIYIWGAQAEQRSSVSAYTATTTQAITNYVPVLLTAGGGQPRFDHNPTTSESLGLLAEEQRTNQCLQSEDFTTTWSSANQVSITSNTIVAPNGTLTGDKLIADATSNVHFVVQNTGSVSAPWTFSCYAKAGEYSRVGFSYSATGYVFFNLSTGVQEGTVGGAITGTSITAVGNGWYRISFTSTSTASGANIGIYLYNTTYTSGVPTFTGNGFSGAYIWGAQLEAASFATSYIPTTSASATRAADVASMSGANFTSWFNAGEGTFYGEANFSNGGRYFHTVNIGSSAQIEGVQATTYFDAFVYTTDVQADIQIAAASFINRRVALAYQVNDIAACVSGGAVSVDTNAILPLNLNAFYVNSYGTTGPLGSGTVKKVAYYPQRLTDAQLQALTS